MRNILMFLIIIFAFSFTGDIQNISVGQRTDGSGIIDISYDLLDPSDFFPTFIITAQISFDNGQTWIDATDFQISGDYGEVEPGNGKSIQLWAPGDTFTQSAKIKLFGEGHYVTSELPFATVTVTPGEITVFESEIIDYSYQIMQYELTNSQLVEWLETYTYTNAENYDLDNPWSDTGDAQYSCSKYDTYHFTSEGGGFQEEVQGCTNPNALNFNESATYQDDSCECVYGSIEQALDYGGRGIGCTECGVNIVNESNLCNGANSPCGDGANHYNDCSCSTITEISSTELGMFQLGDGSVQDYCYWDQEWSSENNQNFSYLYSGCGDPNALNYVGDFINECESNQSNWNIVDCCTFENDLSACVYECTQDDHGVDLQGYSNLTEYFSSGASPGSSSNELEDLLTLKDFQTTDISYVGSAFTISPGKSDHPVIFDGQDCLHSIVLSLYTNYFGLRIPTAGEWMKSARGDNTRCWPWMDSTCQNDTSAYCDPYFNCLSQDEQQECDDQVRACEQECDDIKDNCQNQLGSSALECMQNCFYTEKYGCMLEAGQALSYDYANETACLNAGGIGWFDSGENLYPDCVDCVDDISSAQWSMCFSNEGGMCYCDDFSTSILDGCSECAELCNITEGNQSCEVYNVDADNSICANQNIDFDQDGEIDNPSCNGTYSSYCEPGDCDSNNCWNGNNDCEDGYRECAGLTCGGQDVNIDEQLDCSECNEINYQPLSDIMQQSVPADSSFIDYLYHNRFNLLTQIDDPSNVSEWEGLSSVGQYPLGISPLGLYDVIGNAPELISQSDQGSTLFYIMGPNPSVNQISSFCTDSSFGDQNGGHLSYPMINNEGYVVNRLYGVRLVRVVSDSE